MAVTFRGSAAIPVVFGNNATTHNLMVVENGIGSGRDVIIRRMALQNDSVALYTAVMPLVKTSRPSGTPSGGVLLSEGAFDTTLTSSALIQIRGATSDSAIVATAGTTIWEQYTTRSHTAAEQRIGDDANILPRLIADTGREFKLHPGEKLLAQVVGSVAAANDSQMNNWIIQLVWEEDTLATFTISGTVTLSAVGVVGAEVAVIVADDVAMTNAYLHSVQVTTTGGAWSAAIPTGKLAFAYAQNDVAGTKYTSPGRPYQA